MHEAALIDSHLTHYWPILQADLQSEELTKIREKIGEKVELLENEGDNDVEEKPDPIAVKRTEELAKKLADDMKVIRESTKRLNSFWPRGYRIRPRIPSRKIISRLLHDKEKDNK